MLPIKFVHLISLLITVLLHLLLLAFLYQEPQQDISIGENGILIDLQGDAEKASSQKTIKKKQGNPLPEATQKKSAQPKKAGDVDQEPEESGEKVQKTDDQEPIPGNQGTEKEQGGKSSTIEDTSRLPEMLNQQKTPQEDFVPYAPGREDGKSPLFTELPEQEEQDSFQEEIPEDVKKTMRGKQPEKTDNEQLQYTLNTYEWSFTHFAVDWAKSLQKWWRAPADYLAGKVPEGGSVWIRVRIDKQGRLVEYKVYKSKVSPEMELRVVQALISSFERPALPEDFPLEDLVVNWRFIYPAVNADVKLRKKN